MFGTAEVDAEIVGTADVFGTAEGVGQRWSKHPAERHLQVGWELTPSWWPPGPGGEEERATSRMGLVAADICRICMNIMGVCDTESMCQANYIPRVNLVSNGRAVPVSKVPGFGLT